jgi:hypothetical protein
MNSMDKDFDVPALVGAVMFVFMVVSAIAEAPCSDVAR